MEATPIYKGLTVSNALDVSHDYHSCRSGSEGQICKCASSVATKQP